MRSRRRDQKNHREFHTEIYPLEEFLPLCKFLTKTSSDIDISYKNDPAGKSVLTFLTEKVLH